MILKLSGGEQQRVAIARCLSYNPNLIIADEPTGNLDNETQKIIMEILTSIAHDDKKTVIVVTHSEKVTEYADSILILTDGNLTPA